MALLSVLTPVLALVLCLVIGYMLVKSKDSQSAEVDSRPWVDQEVLDDTELEQREDGKCINQLKFFSPSQCVSLKIISGDFAQASINVNS